MLSRIAVLFVAVYAAIPEDTLNKPLVQEMNLASFDFGIDAAPLTCNLSIERALAGPYDWKKVVGSGNRFEDSYFFPASKSMIVWDNYRKSGAASLSAALLKLDGFYSPLEKDPKATLWGKEVSTEHIIQGSIGDCYMISVLSSIAEYPDRVKKMFKTQSLNKEGIIAMEVFIKGRPEVVTIDDRLPYGTGAPLFLRATSDSAYWAHMAEKVFAKINVNYEHIGWGWMNEALYIFTGAPSVLLKPSTFTVDQMWDLIRDSDEKKFIMSAACLNGAQGVVGGHAYSLIGAEDIVDE